MWCYGGSAVLCSETCGGKESGRDERAAEAEEVESYEEEFVEGAAGKEDGLMLVSI